MSAERIQLAIVGSGFTGPIVALVATYFKPAGIPFYELRKIELRADELEADVPSVFRARVVLVWTGGQ